PSRPRPRWPSRWRRRRRRSRTRSSPEPAATSRAPETTSICGAGVRRAAAREGGGEIGRERAGDAERAAVGVQDGERGGVQREAVQPVLGAEDAVVLALAVADVADDRTRDVL